MSLVDEARKLNTSDIALGIGVVVAIVSPGFLTIFLYKPELIASLDTFKLLLFSASLTLPIVAINFICAVHFEENSNNSDATGIAIMSMAMSCVVLYLALVTSYLLYCSFRIHLAALAIFQVLLLFVLYVEQRRKTKP